MKSVTPLFDRVVVKATEKDRVTTSGIFIADTAVMPPTEGVVVAVGPDVTAVKPGDAVVYMQYAGSPFTWTEHIPSDGESFSRDEIHEVLLFNVRDILGIVTE